MSYEMHAAVRPARDFVAPAVQESASVAETPAGVGDHDAHSLIGWVLDSLDQGVLLVDWDSKVLLANRRAVDHVTHSDVMALSGGRLRACRVDDDRRLADAVAVVSRRAQCRLLRLGSPDDPLFLALSAMARPGGSRLVLCLLGRTSVGNPLTLQWYAQCCGLTAAESLVLKKLCAGLEAADIAALHGVALSTVRTQLAAIRAKTGRKTIRSVQQTLACLPAMCGASATIHALQ